MVHLGFVFSLFGALAWSAIIPFNNASMTLDVPSANGTSLNSTSFGNSSFIGPKAELSRRIIVDFHYRDNFIKFDSEITHNRHIQFLEFRVTDFYVPNGQDPYLLNQPGDVHQVIKHDYLPALRFRAGRHGSRTAAEWWSTRIKPGESTFNKHPKRLNFAFIGDLVVRTSYSDTNLTTIVLPNIAFGQGHVLATNNWWFAAIGAIHSVADHNAIAIDVERPSMCIAFKRGRKDGKTPVDVITIMVRDREECRNHF